MSESKRNLGKLVAAYGIAPAHLQRAVFIAALSFLFFLAMMFAFYIRQQIGYFLLSTAFLLVYLVTLFSWVIQRKNVVKIFEDGIEYRKFSASWDDITLVSSSGVSGRSTLEITPKDGKPVILPSSIHRIEDIERFIRARISK